MKKRSGKNFIRFFYHFLVVLVMAMPMLSGLVRIIYVQSNKNAYESYSDYLSVTLTQIEDTNLLESGNNYYFKIDNSNAFYSNSATIYFSFCDFDFSSLGVSYSVGGFRFSNGNIANYEYYFIYLYDIDNSTWSSAITFPDNLKPFECNLVLSSYEGDPFSVYDIYINTFVKDTLDNVFDYSIDKTMKDFTFHSDFRFTDIANGILMTFDNNNLYIQYINFYINWVLTCAVISFAPYVLLTFYHLAIGLLDKFMKKGEDL